MAQHKDALKRIKQSEKKRLRNKSVRTHYRTKIKEVREAVGSGDKDSAQKTFLDAVKALDTAVSKNVLHKKTADRHKSRLSKAVSGLNSGA